MLISEIFHSLQGEGELTGVPSVFVRTSGCNLRCKWCDTPYASWKPEGSQMSVEAIVDEVKKYPVRHCVLTGGEPLLAPGIEVLAATLHAEGYHITLETAGTIAPAGIACDLASLSPKLANSSPEAGTIDPVWIERHDATRLQVDVLKAWVANYHYQFKFVIGAEQDLAEVSDLMTLGFAEVPRWKIQLMPEGTDPATLACRRTMLLDFCKRTGYRYCDRLHIHLFGNTRGT
jgi:7-carboxy-7-deazaguanine synthase